MEDVFDRKYGIASVMHNPDVNIFSPVFGDVERKVSYDEDKREVVSFVPVDYQKLRKERGVASDWTIDAMLKAGINPNFPIHTGSMVSRVEGVSVIEQFGNEVNELFPSEENKE